MTPLESLAMSFDYLPVAEAPFPHVLADDWLDSAAYSRLAASFPDCPRNSGPTGYTLFWGDPEYDRLIAQDPDWSAFFHAFHNQQFIEYSIRQFASVFEEEAVVDLSGARYVPFAETRADKQRATIADTGLAPDDLWVRVDIMQGRPGYSRGAHLDHRRRAITLLIYFSDATEMVGGELLLHASDGAKTMITPRQNRMVMFPCSNASMHSVAPIVSQSQPRNFVQVTVSSSIDLWEPLSGYAGEKGLRPPSLLRRAAMRLFG